MADEQTWVEFRDMFDLVTEVTLQFPEQTALDGGMQLHRSSCPAALALFQPGERMLVKWWGRSMGAGALQRGTGWLLVMEFGLSSVHQVTCWEL